MGSFIIKRKTFAAPIGFGTKVASAFRNSGKGMNPATSRALWGAGIGAVANGTVSALTGDGDNAGKNFLSGAASGAMIGGSIGAASGAIKNYKANMESGVTQRMQNVADWKANKPANLKAQTKTLEEAKANSVNNTGAAGSGVNPEAQKFQMDNGLGGGSEYSDKSEIKGQKLFSKKSSFTFKRKLWN